MATSKTRRALTSEELAECARLRSAWLAWQEADRDKNGRKVSQESFAETHLRSGQSNFGHYLHGRQALNLETLLVLSQALGVDPSTISPRLMKVVKQSDPNSAEAALVELFKALPEEIRQQSLDFIEFQIRQSRAMPPEKLANYLPFIDKIKRDMDGKKS